MKSTPSPTTIVTAIRYAQQTGDIDYASSLFAQEIELLLVGCDPATLETLLAGFSPDLLYSNNDFCFVQGMLDAHVGRIVEALRHLERARFSYLVSHPYSIQAIRCALELANLYHVRRDFWIAYHYLYEEVKPLIDQARLTDPALCARFNLYMATIMPDVGKLGDAIGYARQALAFYKTVNDPHGQFRAQEQIALILVYLGDFHDATRILTLAKESLTAIPSSPSLEARFLGVNAYLLWYRGQLTEAAQVARDCLKFAEQEPTSHYRIHIRLLLGELYCALSEFKTAQQWYVSVRQLIESINYQHYQPCVEAQVAWLNVLEGKLDQATLHIHSSLQSSDLTQTMKFQVVLAIIYLLEKQFEVAQRLFTQSLTFYKNSGDVLATMTIRLYLAQISLKQNNATQSITHLEETLQWLSQRHIAYLPYWWHPQLLSEICAYALASDIFPDVAEQIFINHLGQQSVPALRTLLDVADVEIRHRAHRLLRLLSNGLDALVDHLPESVAKQIIIALLLNGTLRSDGFIRLGCELTTAMHFPKPNPTLLAVFGLYINGVEREEIAKRLGCSLANVRNYITTIYQHFGLTDEEYSSRGERYRQLVVIARERGFVE